MAVLLQHISLYGYYHHGENDSGCGGLDDPEQYEAGELHQGENMDLPQGNVAQVDQVRLVLGWHTKQLDTVKELREGEGERERDVNIVLSTIHHLFHIFVRKHICNERVQLQ